MLRDSLDFHEDLLILRYPDVVQRDVQQIGRAYRTFETVCPYFSIVASFLTSHPAGSSQRQVVKPLKVLFRVLFLSILFISIFSRRNTSLWWSCSDYYGYGQVH